MLLLVCEPEWTGGGGRLGPTTIQARGCGWVRMGGRPGQQPKWETRRRVHFQHCRNVILTVPWCRHQGLSGLQGWPAHAQLRGPWFNNCCPSAAQASEACAWINGKLAPKCHFLWQPGSHSPVAQGEHGPSSFRPGGPAVSPRALPLHGASTAHHSIRAALQTVAPALVHFAMRYRLAQ